MHTVQVSLSRLNEDSKPVIHRDDLDKEIQRGIEFVRLMRKEERTA